MGDNKGIWSALYVFGGFKGLAGLVLVIVGIILMTYSVPDCDKVQKCYKDKKTDKVYDVNTCKTEMENMKGALAKWGAVLLVIGLIGSLSGVLSGVAAKKKDKTAIGFSMCIDLIMTIVSVAMGAIVGIAAGVMKLICQTQKDNQAKGVASCFDDFIKDVCKGADLFGTASIVFFFMFGVVFCTLITDCAATCCCPPDDAPWSAKNQGVRAPKALSPGITGP